MKKLIAVVLVLLLASLAFGATRRYIKDLRVDAIQILLAAAIIFEGATADDYETTVSVTDPTADNTVTVPDSGGTIMLGVTEVSARCGNVSVDPGSIATVTNDVATATVSGLAANDVCTCAARVEFDDDLIFQECRGSTTDTIEIRIYNPTGGALDAGAQTVDYCCFTK